ncbi:MAG: hypothetical protein OQJ89_15395 [Kangiellaceae bacterium]|nr:hypothetical protein [Kangiellaceae bacterium]MCW8998979.1 hypothetical protein [Kangiellaceae bacterium]MCW9018356.1 hypothetical protein [Kangiellaceae bacterium]
MTINKYLLSGLLAICVGIGFVLGSFNSAEIKKQNKDELSVSENTVSREDIAAKALNKPEQDLVKTTRLIKHNQKSPAIDMNGLNELKVENQSLKNKIAELEAQLSTKSEKTDIAPGYQQQALSSEQLGEQALKHVEMLMRKRVMEISGEQLEDFEQRFAQTDSSSDWSRDYQVKLESFIQKNNEKGTHYIQDLRCKSKLCRLEIGSDDHSAWNSLVGEMINQNWYSSLMLQKPQVTESGTLLYFLPERR